MVIWDGSGPRPTLPDRGPKQTLAMSAGMVLKKQTWVRTNRTYKIEAENLKMYYVTRPYLAHSSVAALEA